MKAKRNIPDITIDYSSIDGFTKSVMDLAPYIDNFAIGELTSSKLSRLAVKRIRDTYYHSFEIPKKSGGTRTITAPSGDLMKVLRVMAYSLNDLYGFVPFPVMGFVEGCSVVTNANEHVGKSYVLNIDLKNFFPSISKRMVVSALKRMDVDNTVAHLIARICCYSSSSGSGEHLPQGSPSSPVLSNIVCSYMDARLTGLAKSLDLTYTRYADDITFSSNHNVFMEGSLFWSKLSAIVSENGFAINEKKTRLLRPWNRQEVTGVTVNNNPNVSRKYLKNLRAEINRMHYRNVTMEEWGRVMGKINYVRMVRTHNSDKKSDYRSNCLLYDAQSVLIEILQRKSQ